MARKSSIFDYDVRPVTVADMDKPVTRIMEMNDGYMVVMTGNVDNLNAYYDDSDNMFGGGLTVESFGSLREMLLDERYLQEDEAGNLVFEDGDSLETFLARITGKEGTFVEQGLIDVKQMTGRYRDAERIFETLYMGEDC